MGTSGRGDDDDSPRKGHSSVIAQVLFSCVLLERGINVLL